MKKIATWILLLLLALVLFGPVLAQVSPHFDLGWHVLSGGSGSRNSARYQLDDALGQWPDGLSSSDQFQIDPGFWHVGRAVKAWRLYLPVAFNPG